MSWGEEGSPADRGRPIVVPGSQNGFDNSGQRGQIAWQTGPGNVGHTKSVIRMLAKKYALPEWNNVVTAIELVNERKPAAILVEIELRAEADEDECVNVSSHGLVCSPPPPPPPPPQ